jgi:hypothetical protein
MSKFNYTKNSDEKLGLVVEQMEVCADLIKTGDHFKCRMAIILLDNLIDILMYRFCISKISFDQFTMQFMPPKFSDREVADAEESIHGKIKLLRKKIKKLTKTEETIIAICHSYRNSAQHRDEHNPNTTIIFSKILFGVVCKFLVRLQGDGVKVTSYYSGRLPDWASKYITGTQLNYEEFSKIFAAKISKGIRVSLESIKKILSDDISYRIHRIDEMIDNELPKLDNKKIDLLFKMYEFEQTEIFKEICKSLYELRYKSHDNSISQADFKKKYDLIEEANLQARINFVPTIRFSTFQKIKKGLCRIQNSKSTHKTLRTYEGFNLTLEKIETFVIRAADEWDKQQQLELDIARGK